MEKILSSFVGMHCKKSYKRYVGTFIGKDRKLKTFYRVFIDSGVFNSLNNDFEELENLFNLMIKKSSQLLEITSYIKVQEFIENCIVNFNNLNEYIENINNNDFNFNNFTNSLNQYVIEFDKHFKNDIKLIKNKILTYTNNVFIGIKFDDDYFDNISKIIHNSVLKCNLNPRQINNIMHNENINNFLYKEMDNSDFGIFELSSLNNNVFYEIGYLDGKGKETIIIAKKVLLFLLI